ncbi:MAG: endonuclease/exonuclease/phosphatase family protein [Gammaproteobacteria bacterium]|nr:endonuclease/exonuclease/phosphatase family protein [Gammaproteobacteria bacterium]
MRLIRPALLFCAALMLASCAVPRAPSPGYQLPDVAASASHADLCAASLAGAAVPGYAPLDSGDIEILNWNIQKGGNPGWRDDLDAFVDQPDLLLFQEAALSPDDWSHLAAEQHTSFAPGYRTRQALTGVMTVSAAQPLTQCNLVSHEPWLRSPKATMVSEYALTDTDETLLVVNVHSVNFTFGLRDFSSQISEIESVVESHSGPVLLSGDFNTWRGRRAEIVQQAAESLGLEKLDFAVDHRKRIFGQALDHIYVRGFEVVHATTQQVQTSDHNPMSVRLRL